MTESTSGAELTLGSLSLLTSSPHPADYRISALGDGTDWGNPEAVVASVVSMLLDGERATITRFGNREATISLQISGDTLAAVAAGEAALMAEVNKGRNALTWMPPGWSTPQVFDVVYSTLSRQFDDLAEALQVTRRFTLTLVCLPGVRRQSMTTVVATPIPSAPTITLIDNCSSATGWSSGTVVSGNLAVTADGSGLAATTRTGLAVSLLSTDYVVVTMVWAGSQVPLFRLNGVRAGIAAAVPGGGVTRYFLRLGTAATLASLSIQVSGLLPGAVVTIQNVDKYNQLPGVGSPRQRTFNVNLGGTMRAAADLQIDSSSTAVGLGDEVLIYSTITAGLMPALRPFLYSSDIVLGGSTMVSGGYQDIGTTPSVYRIPLQSIRPGSYLLMSRMLSNASVTRGVTWSAQVGPGWANNANVGVTGSVAVDLTTAGRFFQLGRLGLPLAQVGPDNVGYLEITLQGTGGTVNLLDELYLFDLDGGQLTWLAGLTRASDSATPSKVLLQNATLDSDGLPRWMVGTTGTGADDVSAVDRVVSLGVHEFAGSVASTVFVVTPGETTQTVTARAYERFAHSVPDAA